MYCIFTYYLATKKPQEVAKYLREVWWRAVKRRVKGISKVRPKKKQGGSQE